MGNITFGSFIAEKRKAHKFNLRDTAKHLNIAYGYLCDIEQSRRPAPNGDFVERISAFLNLDKSEHELLLDLAAKSRNTVSADLPDYIMEKDIVRAALRVAKEVDATDEESKTPDPVEDTEPKTADTAVTESDESDAAKILELLKNPETAALLKQLAKAL